MNYEILKILLVIGFINIFSVEARNEYKPVHSIPLGSEGNFHWRSVILFKLAKKIDNSCPQENLFRFEFL